MAHINRRRTDTRLQIIRLGLKLFTEEGYTKTSAGRIAKELDISPGNITFYFPTKEHLLAVLTEELCDFQWLMLEQEVAEGKSSMLSYCLELVAVAAICEEDEVARDFYRSLYASPICLKVIRDSDAEKCRDIFGEYRPDWNDLRWQYTENLVSGIEFATLMTDENEIPLNIQIEGALSTILGIYGVPDELKAIKIQKALSMDYRALGRRMLREFREYIDNVNEAALDEARERRKNKKASRGEN